MKSIREIYNSLKKRDETILFQVKRKSTLYKMLEEFENEIEEYIFWDRYKGIPIKDIYLCVGNWRLGMAGIFTKNLKDVFGEYCFDHFCIDWKSDENSQEEQKEYVDKFIEIMDRHREDIKVSKKKYEDFE